MEFIKWQNVIVEWVNCLNLSKPVHSISELKNEEFFKKLLHFLINTDSSEGDVSLIEFLKKHYPAYYLESESTLIQDDVEICNICSLLLHYCCFIDGRSEFTAPLCHNLNTNAQFCIKAFLEYVVDAEVITRDVINDAFLCINKSNCTPTKVVTSPKDVQSTPLFEFLKTPLKKQQVLDSHKREIITLQAQLDFERFEKSDIQEELNTQYNKNKKLEKVVSDKQSEISKLRSELLNLENFSPPSNSTTDNREHKRLKDEIQSLEAYIRILHKEQEDLQNERDRARDKHGKMEENIQEWQSRALNYERQNTKIIEENEEYKCELHQLREKCDELSSILKEMNAKNVCDESYEIDHIQEHFYHNRSGSIDYDNLAHTVVDVQLIDAQEENKSLRKQIGDLEINTSDLTEQLNALHTEISNIMRENKNLLDKITDINGKNELLESKLSETELNLKYYQNENDNLIKNIDDLKLEKYDLQIKLEEFTETNSKLDKSFTTLNERLSELLQESVQKFSFYFKENLFLYPDTISNLENLFSNLKMKIQNDTQECENLTQKLTKLEIDHLSSEKEKNDINNRMQNLEEESLKNDKLIIICKNSIEEKSNEITSLQSALKNKEQTVEKLEIRISDLSSSVEDMEGMLNNMKISLENEKRELEEHKISLKISQAKVEQNNKIFEDIILNNDKLIDELRKENVNFSFTIKKLEEISQEDKEKVQEFEIIIEEKTRENFQLKDENHHLMYQIEVIEERLRDEKGAKDTLNLKLQNSESQFESLKIQHEEISEEKLGLCTLLEEIDEKLKKEILERKHIEETCEIISTKLNEKEIIIEDLLNQKMDLDKKLQNSESQFENLKIQHEEISEEKLGLCTLLEEIDEKLKKEILERKHIEETCEIINTKLNEKEIIIEDLLNQKMDLDKTITKLNEDILLHNKSKIETEEKCTELQTLIQDIEEQAQTIRIQFEDFKIASAENLQKHINNLNSKLATAEDTNETLKIKLKDMTKALEDKSEEIQELKVEKRELQEQHEVIEEILREEKKDKEDMNVKLQNAELIIAEFKIKIEERNKCIEEITKEKSNICLNLQETEAKLVEEEFYKKTIEADCEKIKNNLTDKDNIIEILENQKVELNKNIEDLNEEMFLQKKNKSEIERKCEELKKIIQDIEAQMKILKVDKSKLNQQLEDMKKISSDSLRKHQENLGLKIDILKRELENAEESNRTLKIKLEDMMKKIQEKSQQITSLEDEKRKCEEVIAKLNEEITEKNSQKLVLETELNNLNKILHEKKIVINNLTTEKNNVEEQLVTLNNQLAIQLNDKATELEQHLQNFDLFNIELSTIVKMFENEENIHECDEKNLLSTLTTVKNNICNVIFEKRRLENEITNLQQQIVLSENLKSTLDDEYKNKITEHKNKLKEYEENLAQTAQNVQKLMENHEKEIQKYINQQDSLKSELEQIQNSYKKSLETQTKIQSTNFELQENNYILNEKISELNTKLEELDCDKNSLNLQLDDLSSKINSLEQTREQIAAEMEQTTKDSQENLSELLKELQEEKNKNFDLITICKDHFNKFSDLYLHLFENNYNKDVLCEINNIKDQKQLTNDKIKGGNELINKLFDFISNEISNLKKTVKQLSNYETIKSDLATLQHKYELSLNTETENGKLNSKICDLNLEISKYQQQISEKQLIISKYEKEIEIMRITCDNWQKIVNENETDHKKLQHEFQNLKEKYHINNDKLQLTVVDLQQQIKDNNNVITEHENKYEELFKKYETVQEKISSIDPEILNLQTKIINYKKVIAELEDKNKVLNQKYTEYTEIRADNSKLLIDCQVLQQKIEERNNQLSCLTHIKDSYEKLLEDNNKVNMELDTLRYKRTRDKEEFKRILEEQNTKSNEQIQVVRNEYEEKLKKMKEKIVKLYREEVEKEKKKVCTLQQGQAEETISTLKSQLWVTGNKYVDLKKEYEKLASQVSKMKSIENLNDVHGSRNSLHSLPNFSSENYLDDRRTSTLPRESKIELIEESVTISRKRRSITAVSGLQMEDEQGEIFNNTYLADLKAGRCIVSDRESISSTSNRMSELQYRNSLCPPHLKSSYPLETQFSSPGHFKEDDIKLGGAELDDSITVLIPGERPKKKDRGQTLYKKPGPPTPSKHGGQGRLSFQGAEVAPLREQNLPAASQGPRNSSTPSRIRALFSRSGRDTENVTPRGPNKRRSIFRR